MDIQVCYEKGQTDEVPFDLDTKELKIFWEV